MQKQKPRSGKPFLRQLSRHILSTYFLLVCLVSLLLLAGTAGIMLHMASRNTIQFLRRSGALVAAYETQAKKDALDAYVSDEGKLLRASITLTPGQQMQFMKHVQTMIQKNSRIHSMYCYNAIQDQLVIFGSYNCSISRSRYLDQEEISFLLDEAAPTIPYMLKLLDSIHIDTRSLVYTTVYRVGGGDALVINLDAQALFGSLSGSISSSGNDRYAIIASDGSILYSNITEQDAACSSFIQEQILRYGHSISDSSAAVWRGGQLYQISTHHPDGAPWSVIVISDWHDLFPVSPLVLLLFVLVIPLGFLVALVFNRSVSQLVTTPYLQISSELNLKTDPQTSSLDDMLSQISSVRLSMQRSLPIQQRHFLSGVLYNGISAAEFFRECEQLQLPFRKDSRFILLYTHWYNLPDDLSADPLPAEQIRFALKNVMDELCVEFSSLYVLDSTQDPAVLLAELTESQFPGALFSNLNSIHTLFRDRLYVNLFFGISDPVSSPDALHRAWEDLMQRFSGFQYFHPERGVVFSREVRIRDASTEEIPFSGLAQLRKAVCSDDKQACQKLLKVYFQQLQSADYETVQFSLSMLCMQAEGMRRDLSKSYPPLAEYRNAFQTVQIAPTLAMAQDQFQKALDGMSSVIHLSVSGARDQLIDTILDYLSQSYADPSLSAKQIAASYHISTASLNQMCNQRTGKSAMSYLKDFRLQKASELLQNSNLTVETIAVQVGFENTTYFHTAFKAAYGCTPSRYRSMHAAYGDQQGLS